MEECILPKEQIFNSIPTNPPKTEQIIIAPQLKRNLLVYLIVTAISFSFLVITPGAGASVLIFMIIQADGLYYLLEKKKHLIMLVPIFILALNAFISANTMWQVTNLFVGAVLYGLMALWIVRGISFKDTSVDIFICLIATVCKAFTRFFIPFKWGAEAKVDSMPIFRRVLLGVALSIPTLIFLTAMLSRADMIFSQAVINFIDGFFALIQMRMVARILLGIIAGLYLFGILYGVFTSKNESTTTIGIKQIAGDCLIINIMLTSVLLVYTLFVAIQFRYLFAPSDSLPYGLTFVTYARRGFFELLFLTFVNIASILMAVWLTKTQTGCGAKFAKASCMYLCAVTVVLLISSFYRMWLYGSDDGLTRMRLLVFGFLIFEFIGLIFTFFYIAKPKFNIVLVYCFIGLSYYLMLNLVPIDRVIAREQINRYFATGHGGIHYAMSLSPDAAPEIARLFYSDNEQTRMYAQAYFSWPTPNNSNWRQWNFSRSRALRLRR